MSRKRVEFRSPWLIFGHFCIFWMGCFRAKRRSMMFFCFPNRRHLCLAFVLLMVENPGEPLKKVGIASLIAKKPGCVCFFLKGIYAYGHGFFKVNQQMINLKKPPENFSEEVSWFGVTHVFFLLGMSTSIPFFPPRGVNFIVGWSISVAQRPDATRSRNGCRQRQWHGQGGKVFFGSFGWEVNLWVISVHK